MFPDDDTDVIMDIEVTNDHLHSRQRLPSLKYVHKFIKLFLFRCNSDYCGKRRLIRYSVLESVVTDNFGIRMTVHAMLNILHVDLGNYEGSAMNIIIPFL